MLEVDFRATATRWPATSSPLQVAPGKFTYRLVRAEVDFADYGTVEAHCTVDGGHTTVVPYTLIPGPAG